MMSGRGMFLLLLLWPLVFCALLPCRPGTRRWLRRTLLGRSKRAIAGYLGQPTTVALPGDVWYYPLDAERRRALAIRFRRGVATRVQVIGPGSTARSASLF